MIFVTAAGGRLSAGPSVHPPLAEQLAAFPQTCLRQDRLSLYEQDGLGLDAALANEWRHGMLSLADGAVAGAARFAAGDGRHGSFDGRATSTG